MHVKFAGVENAIRKQKTEKLVMIVDKLILFGSFWHERPAGVTRKSIPAVFSYNKA
jgi:hypothetical protein